MQGDEGVPTRHVVDCGTLVDGYRQLHARVFQLLLQDIPVPLAGTAALVSPAATTPFPLLLSRLTRHRPLYLADPSHEDLEFQRCQIGNDRATYLLGGVAELPDSLVGLGIVLNPFGLQHWRAEAPLYAAAVRNHSRGDAHFFSLDWGPTRYPEGLADLPGIAEEVRFSAQAQLAPYGEETGWRLVRECEVAFGLPHSVEDIAVLLSGEHADGLRRVARQLDRTTVIVGSSVLYRHYEVIV